MVLADKRIRSNVAHHANAIIKVLGRVLGINDPKDFDMDKKLRMYGLDSLNNLEIKQTLDKYFNIILTTQKISEMTPGELLELTKNKI